jgi:hypothetical protein
MKNGYKQNSFVGVGGYDHKDCHTGNNPILKLDGGDGVLHAGGWSKKATHNGVAVVDLAPTKYGARSQEEVYDPSTFGEIAFKRTLEGMKLDEDERIYLPFFIQDYGLPKYSVEVWPLLAADIKALMMEGVDVLVACVGGHGRTGMVTSIVCHLLVPEVVGDDPVAWIRRVHCSNALDTQAQEEYVFGVLGIPIPDLYKPKGKTGTIDKLHTPVSIRETLKGWGIKYKTQMAGVVETVWCLLGGKYQEVDWVKKPERTIKVLDGLEWEVYDKVGDKTSPEDIEESRLDELNEQAEIFLAGLEGTEEDACEEAIFEYLGKLTETEVDIVSNLLFAWSDATFNKGSESVGKDRDIRWRDFALCVTREELLADIDRRAEGLADNVRAALLPRYASERFIMMLILEMWGIPFAEERTISAQTGLGEWGLFTVRPDGKKKRIVSMDMDKDCIQYEGSGDFALSEVKEARNG